MVDAVNNNNRNTVIAASGLGLGAVAGGAYGYTKSLLKNDAPTDAFVRSYVKNDAKAKIDEAKNAIYGDAFKDADVAALKKELKDNATKYGLAEVKADADGNGAKTLDEVIEEFAKDTDKDSLKEKMSKAAGDTKSAEFKNADDMLNLKKAAAGLADDADEAARTAFVKNNAELLGVAEADVENIGKKTVAELKQMADDATKPLADAKANILAQFKDGKLKPLAENADESAKAAFKAVKDAASNAKLWAGAKWAGIGAATLGAASYLYAKMTDKA